MIILFWVCAVVCAVLDRITKVIAEANITDTVPVIRIGDRDIFWFSLIHNTGAAFSSFSGQTAALSVFTVVLLTAIVIYYHKQKDKNMFTSIVFGMIVGGGLGNLFDRVVYGKVTDFLNLFPFTFIFNVADIFVVIGAILLIIYMLFFEERHKQEYDPEKEIPEELYAPPGMMGGSAEDSMTAIRGDDHDE
ncbi:MAG: signal peptidase II [Oscillospiraceae bacterium]|nr:signal peptidase II [Oscillospiraceae bacterium]